MITVSHGHSVEDNFETVVMTDEEAVSFGIQRSLEFDDQDRATGMDNYCLVADSGAASYGGLREWVRAGEARWC
ncbi:Imm10 family immunity protein [Propionibacteriaceae bacterium Y1685]